MKPQLFLIHFAGGNCYSFQFMKAELSAFEVIPVELPGRGKRMQESLLLEFDAAAADVYAQVLKHLRAPVFVIYGHSMGAYLALRVTNMLEKKGLYAAALVASGNAGPGIRESGHVMRHLMPHEEFITELRSIGGVPDELLINEELFSFYEPVLRADFRISETSNMNGEPAVSCPVYALMGTEEEQTEKITNWANYTNAGFRHEILEGNHFFIHRHSSRIAAVITGCLFTPNHVQ